MIKPLIIAFILAIGFGYFLVNPWVLLYYLVFLAIATLVVLIIVVFSLTKRTRHWKTALICLAVGYTAVLSSYCITSYLSTRIVKQQNHFVTSLYQYRDKFGHFPPTAQGLPNNISALRGNYVPDSTLRKFKLYTRDLYGFPLVFSSKDSAWGR